MAGLALRVVVIDLRPEGAAIIAPDEPEYIEIAQNLWLGDGFTFRGEPTAYRDMLFPAVTALIMKLTGGNFRGMLYLQSILSCLTGWLLYLIGRKRFSETIGLILCGAWIFYPASILFSAMYLTETLFVFLWVLAIVLYDRLEENATLTNAILLGICLGVLCLTRAAGLLMIAAIVIYVVLIRYETEFKHRLRISLVVVAASLVIILPWMIRNYVVMDSFSLNTNGGINLLIGNNRYATGAYRFDEPVQEMLPDESLSEAARDQAAADLASEYFWSDVSRSLNLWSRKFAYLWSTDMAMLAHYLPSRGNASLAEQLRLMPLALLLITAIPYIVILLAGTTGFYLVKKFPTRGFFILQVFMITVAAFLSFGLPRFHFPAMPALMIGAAAFVYYKPLTSAPKWRQIFLLMMLSMFIGIWSYEVFAILGW